MFYYMGFGFHVLLRKVLCFQKHEKCLPLSFNIFVFFLMFKFFDQFEIFFFFWCELVSHSLFHVAA